MGLIIENGGAGPAYSAKVDEKNRIHTKSVSISEATRASLDDSDAYAWTSHYVASSGDEVIYVKNTHDTKDLVIDEVIVASPQAGRWDFERVTDLAAPSGTTLTSVNLNFNSGKTADAQALGDAAVTGLSSFSPIVRCYTGANQPFKAIENGSVILGTDDSVAITYVGGSATLTASIKGFYI